MELRITSSTFSISQKTEMEKAQDESCKSWYKIIWFSAVGCLNIKQETSIKWTNNMDILGCKIFFNC